jgi:hypothetical protein
MAELWSEANGRTLGVRRDHSRLRSCGRFTLGASGSGLSFPHATRRAQCCGRLLDRSSPSGTSWCFNRNHCACALLRSDSAAFVQTSIREWLLTKYVALMKDRHGLRSKRTHPANSEVSKPDGRRFAARLDKPRCRRLFAISSVSSSLTHILVQSGSIPLAL